MKGLAAVFIGTIILANVLADDNGHSQSKEDLDRLLSKEKITKVVKQVQEIGQFVTQLLSVSVQVILEGLNPPADVDLAMLGNNIISGLKKVIEGKVQIYLYLLGRLIKATFPDLRHITDALAA